MNSVTRMPSSGAGTLAKSVCGAGAAITLLLSGCTGGHGSSPACSAHQAFLDGSAQASGPQTRRDARSGRYGPGLPTAPSHFAARYARFAVSLIRGKSARGRFARTRYRKRRHQSGGAATAGLRRERGARFARRCLPQPIGSRNRLTITGTIDAAADAAAMWACCDQRFARLCRSCLELRRSPDHTARSEAAAAGRPFVQLQRSFGDRRRPAGVVLPTSPACGCGPPPLGICPGGRDRPERSRCCEARSEPAMANVTIAEGKRHQQHEREPFVAHLRRDAYTHMQRSALASMITRLAARFATGSSVADQADSTSGFQRAQSGCRRWASHRRFARRELPHSQVDSSCPAVLARRRLSPHLSLARGRHARLSGS